MGRPRGSKNKFSISWAGNRYSVYLSRRAILRLEQEIMDRSKRDKDSLIPPKGLTLPKLVVACVDYVIDEGKLGYVLLNEYPRKKH